MFCPPLMLKLISLKNYFQVSNLKNLQKPPVVYLNLLPLRLFYCILLLSSRLRSSFEFALLDFV